MTNRDKIVAVGFFTQADLDRWGHQLRNVFPVDDSSSFDELLRRIDAFQGNGDRPAAARP